MIIEGFYRRTRQVIIVNPTDAVVRWLQTIGQLTYASNMVLFTCHPAHSFDNVLSALGIRIK